MCQACVLLRPAVRSCVEAIEAMLEYPCVYTGPNTVFDSVDASGSPTVLNYVVRFTHYNAIMYKFEFPVLTHAMVYLSALQSNDPAHQITWANFHRLFAAAFCVAYKFVEDRPPGDKWLAEMSGMSRRELVRLEMVALRCLDYRLLIGPTEFEQVARKWGHIRKKTLTDQPISL